MTNSAAGEFSDYSFSFSVDRDIESTNNIWIKIPSTFDPFIGDSYEIVKECY